MLLCRMLLGLRGRPPYGLRNCAIAFAGKRPAESGRPAAFQRATVKRPTETPTKVPTTTSLIKCRFDKTSPRSAAAMHIAHPARSLGNMIHKTDMTAATAAAWPEGKDPNDRPP